MKSFKMLALVAILGLGACSLNDSDFLDQVKGKIAYVEADFSGKVGEFSTDGKTFTYSSEDFTFDSMKEEGLAKYASSNKSYTISVSGNFHVESK